ncbi:MAG: hypothetical protein IJH86_07330 [Clostridia bacterium]|nr:hypothetical protein [Clostridia bacterium]
MKNIILVIGVVALFVYGGCMMQRLDRYASKENRRRRAAAGPWKALIRAIRKAMH